MEKMESLSLYTASVYWGLTLLGLSLVAVIIYYAYATDVPKIAGIPELPYARPFLGHLHLHGGTSGENDAAVWTRWYKRLGPKADLLQMKFGNRRVVVANSFERVRELFVKNANSTSDRPVSHVFAHFVGYDLGSSSLDDVHKRERLASIKSVQPRKWPTFYPMLRREGFDITRVLAEDGEFGKKPLFPHPFFQRVSMNIAFQVTLGKRFADAKDPWLRDYIENAGKITNVRSGTNTWIDFIPILRLLPTKQRDLIIARGASQKREEMISILLRELQDKMARGEEVDCIAASVLTDKDSSLSLREAVKASMSMLQGGSETVANHLVAGFSGLLTPEGQQIQEEAYQDILRTCLNGDAAEHAFTEEAVPWISALQKEFLRNYVTTPFSLPRAANVDITLSNKGGPDIVIPKGTTLYMNSEGANHDPNRFGTDAGDFNPARWLNEAEINGPGMPYFSYGVGSRLCPAYLISNRIIYGIIFRVILAYKLVPVEEQPAPRNYKEVGANCAGSVVSPKPFGIRFVPRDEVLLRQQLAAEEDSYQG